MYRGPEATEAQRQELFRGAQPNRAYPAHATSNPSGGTVTSNEELLQVGHELHQETTGALQRGLEILHQTQQIQNQTNQVLDDQTKQMARVENDMSHMKKDIRYSEKILNYMARCCCVQCCFVDPEKRKQQDWAKGVQNKHFIEENPYTAPQTAAANGTKKTNKQQAANAVADKYGGAKALPVNTKGLRDVGYGEQADAIDQETRKQDQILDEISDGLDNLARATQAMTETLNRQQKPLEALVDHAEELNDRVKGMNKDSMLRQYKPRAIRK